MKQVIDARGLACPQPVIDTRKALESSESVITIVDNKTAVENIKRMAHTLGCTATEEIKDDGIYMTIEHSKYILEIAGKPQPCARNNQAAPASSVLVISQEAMGRGDDALGHLLIKSFFHTIAETSPVPEVIIFFNSGVKLVVEGSDVIDDIRLLEGKGVKILACGTCLDYFRLKDKIQAGVVSNMYEIKDLMLSGRTLVNI